MNQYDSLLGGLWRLIRRRWYVFVAAVLLGALVGGILGASGSYTGEATFRIGSLEDAASVLDVSDAPTVEVQRLAQQADLDVDQADIDGLTDATFSANSTARTVTVVLTAPSEGTLNHAFEAVSTRFTALATDPVTAQIDAGIAQLDTTLDSLEQSADDGLEQFADVGQNDAAIALLVGQQGDIRQDIVNTSERRGGLVALRDYVDASLVAVGELDATAPTATKLMYVAGAIAGGALALLGGAAWVLFDRRVRRAVHVERAAPGVPVLGLMDTTEIDASLTSALRAFAAQAAGSKLVVFGIGPADPTEFARAVGDVLATPVEVTDGGALGALAAAADERASLVGVVRWGRTTEDQVSTAAGDVRRAGTDHLPVGFVLTGVPPRDRDWAAAGTVGDA